MNGILYNVSTGPGDPGLMTVNAVKAIEHCSVIAYPKMPNGGTTAFDIAAGAADMSLKTLLPFEAVMTRDSDRMRGYYEAAAASIEKFLEKGADTALLCLGDAGVYSSGSHIAALLGQKGFATKTISGVTSFCACAAALCQPLIPSGGQLHVFPDIGDIKERLALSGTKVFMKSGSEINTLLSELERHRALKNTSMVLNCGMENERVIKEITLPFEGAGYFATVIVRE